MSTGALSAFLARGSTLIQATAPQLKPTAFPGIAVFSTAAAILYGIKIIKSSKNSKQTIKSVGTPIAELISSYSMSTLFGIGLAVSGMCSPERVTMFLDFTNNSKGWDPTLAAVMAGGVIINTITFNGFHATPSVPVLCSPKTSVASKIKIGAVPENLKIDWKLLLGSALFGCGWGIAGVCPGK